MYFVTYKEKKVKRWLGGGGREEVNCHSRDTLLLLNLIKYSIVYYIERLTVGIYNRFEETYNKTIILDVLQQNLQVLS